MLGPEIGQQTLELCTGFVPDNLTTFFELIVDLGFNGSKQHKNRKAPAPTRPGQSQPHFAAGSVQDATYRVQVLQGWTCRDQNSGLMRHWWGHDPLFVAELSLEMDGTVSIDHTHHSAAGPQPMKESYGTQAPQTW